MGGTNKITDPATGEIIPPGWTVHPAADLFPMATGGELEQLATDIATHGLNQPIWLTVDGDVLDGRNRLVACHRAGITPATQVYEGVDPTTFAVSQNLHRRHLTVGQQACVGAEVKKLIAADTKMGRPKKNGESRVDLPDFSERSGVNRPRDRAAAIVGVSASSIQRAERLEREAPDLYDRVKAGDVALDAADRLLRQPRPKVGDEVDDDTGSTRLVTGVEDYGDTLVLHSGDDALQVGSDRYAEPAITKPDLGGGISHPARYSDGLLPVFADLLWEGARILDPFGGTGKIHKLRDLLAVETIAIEIEPEWAGLHPDTIVGDALQLTFDDDSFDAIVTSPTYGNRLADSHNASDPQNRRTYTHDLGRTHDDNNSGRLQWGPGYRQFHHQAWNEAVRVLRPGGRFVLNIKDHIRKGRWEDVAGWHVNQLIQRGLVVRAVRPVVTGHLRQGTNADLRVDAELVIALDKP